MSNKRRWSLKSKWRLAKQLADYKSHKQKKRSLGYLEEEKVRHKRKSKGGNYCRKLRGEHAFELVELKKYYFFKDCAEIYQCSACKKIKYKFKKNE